MTIAEPRSSDRILACALDLFSSRGYDATSVREICAAADIAKPTLYHFYGSKEGVYRALVEGALVRFESELLGVLEAPGSAAAKLQRMARRYFEMALEHRQVMRFLFAVVHNPPATAPNVDPTRFYERVVSRVGREIEAGVARGEWSEGHTEVRSLVFMGALGESLCGSLLVGRPELTPELADTLVDTILAGWNPPARSTSPTSRKAHP